MFRPFPPSRFQLALLDPPWLWRPYSIKGTGRAPPYSLLGDKTLAELPLPDLMERDAVAAMWTVDSHLDQGMRLLKHWGLQYTCVGFVWVKTTKHGKWHVGLGKLTRKNPEICLFARRGKGLPIQAHDVRQLIISPVREHSRKPDEARQGLERLFGEVSRIELFARERVPGWTPWGLETPPEVALAP